MGDLVKWLFILGVVSIVIVPVVIVLLSMRESVQCDGCGKNNFFCECDQPD